MYVYIYIYAHSYIHTNEYTYNICLIEVHRVSLQLCKFNLVRAFNRVKTPNSKKRLTLIRQRGNSQNPL